MTDLKTEDIKIEKTGFGDIVVLQRKGFGYGVDSVLLSAFAAGETGAPPLRKNAMVSDLGTGSGIIPFIVAHKVPSSSVTGFDVRSDAIDRANQGCEMNGLTDRVSFVRTDIMSDDMLGFRGRFDAVLSNPPYFRRSGAVRSERDDRYIARHETTADLGDFVRTAEKLLMPKGSLYMVHRPDRLSDIIYEMRFAGIEPKTLQMVVPRKGAAPNIMLIHGVKGAGSELKVLPEITVHTSENGYTEEILRLYER